MTGVSSLDLAGAFGSRPFPARAAEMEAFFLLGFAASLALFALSAGVRLRESLTEGDVGHLAVNGVRLLSCAAGAIAPVAIAIGRLA